MPQLRPTKVLGLALTEQAILIAEVVGPQRQLRRHAAFPYPDGAPPADLATLGPALGRFLRKQGFTASHAVVGLPARWIMSKPIELPPADLATATSMLRLAMETAFSTEFKDLAFEFAGSPDPARSTTALLLAIPRPRLAQVQALALAARFRVHAILPSAAALAPAGDALLINVAPKSTVLAATHAGQLQFLRHLPPSVELLPEARRILAALPSGDRSLIVWDPDARIAVAPSELAGQLGLTLQEPSLVTLGLSASAGSTPPEAVAAALAALPLAPAPIPMDFTRSRLCPPAPKTLRRKLLWAAAVAAAIVVAAGILVVDTQQTAAETRELQAKLKRLEPDLKTAKTSADQVRFVRNWYPSDPRFLNCLRQLTLAFPDDGSAWTTSLDIQPTLKGQLSGKATSERVALAVMDRLKASKKFKDVKLQWDAGRTSRDVIFSLTFTYLGTE